MKVAVLGPGGVGGLLAALLARAGTEVVVVARAETAAALARDGLHVESGRFGTFDVPVRATPRLTEPVGAVLVTVKSTHFDDALRSVPREALGDAIVVPFLNGLDHVNRLREIYPPENVVAAVIRIETARTQTGVIRHTSPFVAIELAPSAVNRERSEELVALLRAAGLDVAVRDDEAGMLWDKFAVLEPMALLTTHERAPIGAVRTRRRDDLVAMVRETARVGQAEGAHIDGDRALGFIDSVPESMESSMQRDQAAGRPLELDALGGAVLRRAEKHGIDVPVTRRIVADLAARG